MFVVLEQVGLPFVGKWVKLGYKRWLNDIDLFLVIDADFVGE